MPIKLRSQFIRKNIIKENWHKLHKHKDQICWSNISTDYELCEDFIYEFQNYVHWNSISRCQKLGENLIRDFEDMVDWQAISINQRLSDNFVTEFYDLVIWKYILQFQTLSEKTLKNLITHFDPIEISQLCEYQSISENFIREFKEVIHWNTISKRQILGEDFIREFKKVVYWFYISRYQILSEDFIIEFKNELFDDIEYNKYIKYYSIKLIKIFSPRLNDHYKYNYAANKIREFWLKIYYKPGNIGYNKTITQFSKECSILLDN